MPVIKWRESYSVGVQIFDDEHKVLLGLINEMFDIVRNNDEVEKLSMTINKLIQYTQEHFSDEEQALEKINYPQLDEHKKIHSCLLHDVTAYKNRIDNRDEDTILGLYHFLRDWLLTHILEEDMQYKPFFAEESAKAA